MALHYSQKIVVLTFDLLDVKYLFKIFVRLLGIMAPHIPMGVSYICGVVPNELIFVAV